MASSRISLASARLPDLHRPAAGAFHLGPARQAPVLIAKILLTDSTGLGAYEPGGVRPAVPERESKPDMARVMLMRGGPPAACRGLATWADTRSRPRSS